MRDWQSLSHVKRDCKYHVVFVTKYGHQTIYGKLRRKIGGIIRDLCRQKGLNFHEGHAMRDHVLLCLSIPPKYSVSNTIGFIKGKSAIRFHREILGTKKMTGLNLGAKGYYARIFHEDLRGSGNKSMVSVNYNKFVTNRKETKCHPSGELMLCHLLRVRPLAVGHHSVAFCLLQLTQHQLVKYPG